MQFSRKDKDNDEDVVSCPKTFKGGAWWYSGWNSSKLDGLYLNGPQSSYADVVNWKAFRGTNYSLKINAMKVKTKS